jgi:predicted nucleotidyltransferase
MPDEGRGEVVVAGRVLNSSDVTRLTARYRRRLADIRAFHRQEAERLAAALAARGVHTVILFGSVAQGTDSFNSDIDLVAISDWVHDIPFPRRAAEVLTSLQPNVRTDLLLYTPEEWETLRTARRFVRDEIERKGMLLYPRS